MLIRRARSDGEFTHCAVMMSSSEPWITLGRTTAECVTRLTDSTKEVYLAHGDDDRVDGFLVLDMHGPFPGYIQTVCVAPSARGRGVGTRLVTFAEERIFRESPNVFLCVSSFNPDARRLYERLGYETVGSLRAYLVAEHDEILLRKTRGPWSAFSGSAAPPRGDQSPE